ncbi:DUF72 domain-containing protein [Phytoactinopolyspora halotolerans]|uniref:DUF72 domain-containing protein n=1 Tax=Phytoactinopolyspora halotolerans TaxID=1981512 RepID=A0A6L9SE84_9ACTN|nr:DUF72 domain-containing protein [Phytoactinopolyspora halotolerans]NEE02822.1 DUF72 domain-containing protein [Phytoactinopolyspora halotolerans]
MPVFVGTSGWQYRDWRGVIYPDGLAQRRWFERYVKSFATVESNSAFYRLPRRETFASWRAQMPDDFVMAVKASRFLTHIRRLQEPREPVRRFLDAAAGLGDRLGPVLLQLPPTLQAEPGRLAACLDEFPADVRVAVEPRHTSWWTDEVRSVLEARDAALCWADVRGTPQMPLWRTASWGYLRLHQGAASPWPHYDDDMMRSWARRIGDTWADAEDVYVYFNNDPGGAAVRNAIGFAGIVGATGRTVTRTAQLRPSP